MMDKERQPYIPSPEEVTRAEEYMTEEEQRLSNQREDAFASSEAGELNQEIGTLLYHLDARLLDVEKLNAVGAQEGFKPKPEYHVTVIGTEQGKKVMRALKDLSDVERKKTVEAIHVLIRETDWRLSDSGKDIYHITKDYVTVDEHQKEVGRETRQSYIQFVGLRGVDQFIEKLNLLLGTDLRVQPAHITLNAKSTNPKKMTRGIAIDSREEFESMHPMVVDVPKTATPTP